MLNVIEKFFSYTFLYLEDIKKKQLYFQNPKLIIFNQPYTNLSIYSNIVILVDSFSISLKLDNVIPKSLICLL